MAAVLPNASAAISVDCLCSPHRRAWVNESGDANKRRDLLVPCRPRPLRGQITAVGRGDALRPAAYT